MRTIARARLTFSPPRHGWLPVRFELDEYAIECDASEVLQDPLAEFVELLAFVSKPPRQGAVARVFLWLEPETYLVEARPWSVDDVHVRVWHFSEAAPPTDRMDEADLCFEGSLGTATLSASIRAGLSDLLRRDIPAYDWGSVPESRAAFHALVGH